MAKKISVGALISGGGTNLQAIIDSCESGKIDANMVFVGTDNPDAKGLARAKKHNIPTFIVDYGKIIRQYKSDPYTLNLPDDVNMDEMVTRQTLFKPDADPGKVTAFLITRIAAEAQLLSAMSAYSFDLLVLAGFMRNFTPYFIDRVNIDPAKPRIMNIHPAILPVFPGTDGYGDTFRYGCKVGGCTVHFIDYGEDSGPIIGQKTFDIEETDTNDGIIQKGLKKEWELYPQCIQWFAEDRLEVVTKTHQLPGGREYKRRIVRIHPAGSK